MRKGQGDAWASEWITSPNFTTHDGDRELRRIIIHYTASLNIDGTIAWFKNDEIANVSAHFVIGRDGRIVQMVRLNNIAWHARGHNQDSIGIELVGTADSGFTDRQLEALYTLLEELARTFKISADRVVGHCHVSPGRKIDPDGFAQQFNWTKTREVVRSAYDPPQEG
jgi:N-acetyl-anhydromuramyl-L-alanine amidase AmpD